ncbi:MAG: ANTAR domain-containing protein [Betaproteobacteria bacterium]|nr:ANTAR domain-containing protein [Betaproteobacteria bacterium]MBL8535398.1 ANTAR domain-containing protein [Betaproteobacteria bacterium]
MKTPPTGTSRLLRDLRSLNVVVFHPDDTDGQELIAQLRRIGCRVKAFWPPRERLPEDADLVFLAVRPEVASFEPGWVKREDSPPVIVVVNYENPTMVESVLRMNASGVVASPVKSFGLLTAIVVARSQAERERDRLRYISKLEQRLASQRKLAKAKTILMQTRAVSEEEAYRLIREQAMTKRVTTEEIADAIINANDILSFEGKA